MVTHTHATYRFTDHQPPERRKARVAEGSRQNLGVVECDSRHLDLVCRNLLHCCIMQQEGYAATCCCSFVRLHQRRQRAIRLPCLRHAEIEKYYLVLYIWAIAVDQLLPSCYRIWSGTPSASMTILMCLTINQKISGILVDYSCHAQQFKGNRWHACSR